jgi:hypothetical protein
MQLQTILNRVEQHKSFVYGAARFADEQRSSLEVEVREQAIGVLNREPSRIGFQLTVSCSPR